jgi:hypothetical protein
MWSGLSRAASYRWGALPSVCHSTEAQPLRLLFNKSLVRSFSSFERPHRRLGGSSSGPVCFQQKPGMQLFFFRKTSSSVWLALSHRHGCSIFADWLGPILACGV